VTIRLYVDEDAMDRDLVQALRARGVDVITALDAGMIERRDEEHLDYATAHGRVLYTFNVGDFYRLHIAFQAQRKPHAGLILTQQQRYSLGQQMRRLVRLIASKSVEDMMNHVEFLPARE